MLETWLRFLRTAVDRSIVIEEVEGVEAEDSKLVGNNLDKEPSTSFEAVTLLFWNESPPNIGEGFGPSVGPF